LGVGVRVLVGALVGVEDGVAVGVAVAVAVGVGVAVGVEVWVGVGVLVSVGVSVAVAVGTSVAVAVGAGVGVGGAVGLQAARNKAADTRVRRRRVIIGSFRSLQLRRLELKHTQLLRLSARAQRQHFDADDVASLIEVQNYTRLDFLRLEDRGVG
jgi:hypothetical protein